jgi:hypothetical protein
VELGRDTNHLGADRGLIAVFHTWGQHLLDHPHLHGLVPGGGVSDDGQTWHTPKNATKHTAVFLHVNVLSELFKKTFLASLKHAYQAGQLKCVGEREALGGAGECHNLLTTWYGQQWVTYGQPPCGGPDHVLTDLARYTHRVAISKDRLVSVEAGNVTFRWHDEREGKEKRMP